MKNKHSWSDLDPAISDAERIPRTVRFRMTPSLFGTTVHLDCR